MLALARAEEGELGEAAGTALAECGLGVLVAGQGGLDEVERLEEAGLRLGDGADVDDGQAHLLQAAVALHAARDGHEAGQAGAVLVEDQVLQLVVGLDGLAEGNSTLVAHGLAGDVEEEERLVRADAVEEVEDVQLERVGLVTLQVEVRDGRLVVDQRDQALDGGLALLAWLGREVPAETQRLQVSVLAEALAEGHDAVISKVVVAQVEVDDVLGRGHDLGEGARAGDTELVLGNVEGELVEVHVATDGLDDRLDAVDIQLRSAEREVREGGGGLEEGAQGLGGLGAELVRRHVDRADLLAATHNRRHDRLQVGRGGSNVEHLQLVGVGQPRGKGAAAFGIQGVAADGQRLEGGLHVNVAAERLHERNHAALADVAVREVHGDHAVFHGAEPLGELVHRLVIDGVLREVENVDASVGVGLEAIGNGHAGVLVHAHVAEDQLVDGRVSLEHRANVLEGPLGVELNVAGNEASEVLVEAHCSNEASQLQCRDGLLQVLHVELGDVVGREEVGDVPADVLANRRLVEVAHGLVRLAEAAAHRHRVVVQVLQPAVGLHRNLQRLVDRRAREALAVRQADSVDDVVHLGGDQHHRAAIHREGHFSIDLALDSLDLQNVRLLVDLVLRREREDARATNCEQAVVHLLALHQAHPAAEDCLILPRMKEAREELLILSTELLL
mmetsp:Transcript_22643/g.89578  ORF Transcript_22643/g.89578 Transcript_22643/m.89578 type:complete len:675 (+) Transcript_22643:1201-3225(+)